MNDTLDCHPSTVLNITTTKTTKNVLTHAHKLATGMCTAGVEKKKFYPSGVHVCACVRVCVCPSTVQWLQSMCVLHH